MSTEGDEIIEEGVAIDATGNVIIEDEEAEALPKRAKWLDDGSVQLDLRFPVRLSIKSSATGQVREDVTDKLVFKRLKGAQLLEAQGSSSFMRLLIARSTGMTEAKTRGLLDNMDASDTFAAMKVIGIFTGSGQTTGL